MQKTFRVHRTRSHGPCYTIVSRPPLFVFKLGGSKVLHFFANFSKIVEKIANIVLPQTKPPWALPSAPTVGVLMFKIWEPNPSNFASTHCCQKLCYGQILMPVGSTRGYY